MCQTGSSDLHVTATYKIDTDLTPYGHTTSDAIQLMVLYAMASNNNCFELVLLRQQVLSLPLLVHCMHVCRLHADRPPTSLLPPRPHHADLCQDLYLKSLFINSVQSRYVCWLINADKLPVSLLPPRLYRPTSRPIFKESVH